MVRRLVVEMWDVKGKCEYSECIASDSQQVVVLELEVGRVLITACYKIV
jgi:hypothetical protein